MSATHTPGPWTVEPSRHGFAFDVRYAAGDATVAMIYPPAAWIANLAPGRETEMVANANLIAAAPALAEALEHMRPRVASVIVNPYAPAEVVAMARADLAIIDDALRKAGREP